MTQAISARTPGSMPPQNSNTGETGSRPQAGAAGGIADFRCRIPRRRKRGVGAVHRGGDRSLRSGPFFGLPPLDRAHGCGFGHNVRAAPSPPRDAQNHSHCWRRVATFSKDGSCKE
jgi:hypothetical protein